VARRAASQAGNATERHRGRSIEPYPGRAATCCGWWQRPLETRKALVTRHDRLHVWCSTMSGDRSLATTHASCPAARRIRSRFRRSAERVLDRAPGSPGSPSTQPTCDPHAPGSKSAAHPSRAQMQTRRRRPLERLLIPISRPVASWTSRVGARLGRPDSPSPIIATLPPLHRYFSFVAPTHSEPDCRSSRAPAAAPAWPLEA
jgi:hypothetical protein